MNSQFDATNGTLDSIVRLRQLASDYAAIIWVAAPMAYDVLCQTRFPDGRYILEPTSSMDNLLLLGLAIVVNPNVPKDTIELRDKDDRIVGKIYNIG